MLISVLIIAKTAIRVSTY